jgi:D-alanyl-D-alanine carboxypeptidase (penicillin-binding protein 5/6)
VTNPARPLALLAAIAVILALALASTMTAGAQPVLTQPAPPPPIVTPNTDACPFALAPPPVIDLSEVPQPGQGPPAALARPASPVGGGQLARCGLVTIPGSPAVPQGISSASWVLADLDSGQVLAAKDPHGRYRPASTLKLLTAAVALNALPLGEVITATQADADVEGSRVGVGPGGRYTVRELMLGLLLQSGNDAAHALAARMGGDAATVRAMNALAASLGATDTRAITPSGLDGPGMSTSAYDLALIFRHDIANPVFAQLASTPTVLFPGYADKPPFVITNQDHLLTDYPGAIGGKNGFTNDAGQTYGATGGTPARGNADGRHAHPVGARATGCSSVGLRFRARAGYRRRRAGGTRLSPAVRSHHDVTGPARTRCRSGSSYRSTFLDQHPTTRVARRRAGGAALLARCGTAGPPPPRLMSGAVNVAGANPRPAPRRRPPSRRQPAGSASE